MMVTFSCTTAELIRFLVKWITNFAMEVSPVPLRIYLFLMWEVVGPQIESHLTADAGLVNSQSSISGDSGALKEEYRLQEFYSECTRFMKSTSVFQLIAWPQSEIFGGLALLILSREASCFEFVSVDTEPLVGIPLFESRHVLLDLWRVVEIKAMLSLLDESAYRVNKYWRKSGTVSTLARAWLVAERVSLTVTWKTLSDRKYCNSWTR